ncbi:anoctamin-10-like [Tigriopus californicus]|uniref:anoctamin-10-like n=1 Tax=Tigriopus californicus TaxID=6832 RepID=UPI0027DAB22D|nr:anoctamin-10-like [Tigriopus californicus]
MRLRSSGNEKMDASASSSPSYYVVCLHEKCSQEAAQFMADHLSAPVSKDGAGLIVEQEVLRPNGLILHISASRQRVLELAETVGIKKPDLDGVICEFEIAQADRFPESGLVGPLTLSDIHRCVLYAMEFLHFDHDRKYLPGHEDSKIMKGAPMLSAYREAGYIDTFPLHDDETLERLHKKWKHASIFNPPLDDIRDYFGENVALYFSFATFYTYFLMPIALIGIVQFILDRFLHVDFLFSNVTFSCLNLIGVTIFLEMWKRKSNKHNYHWGTGGKLRHKRARPEFRGELGINKITGKEEMQYPFQQTLKKVLFVSLPITVACLLVAFFLMLLSFQAEKFVYQKIHDPMSGEIPFLLSLVSNVPSIVYSILVFLMNHNYLHLAHFLTEWENHRTQEQFERHVVSKLVLFEFVNTFLALFYIAFYLQDIVMLKNQVFTMLIIQQIIGLLQETILPIVLKRPSTRRVMKKISKRVVKDLTKKFDVHHKQLETLPFIDNEESKIAMANYSLHRDPYESTYDDFMEMWLQFGHVFLFSSVYPLAGFLALLNNLFELKVDAYKLCRLARKPTPRSVRDIGAWYMAFSVTSVISVMTNCALLAMDKDVQAFAPHASGTDWALTFVVIEHVFLLIRLAIDKLIPDVSNSIKFAIDRDNYILKNRRVIK